MSCTCITILHTNLKCLKSCSETHQLKKLLSLHDVESDPCLRSLGHDLFFKIIEKISDRLKTLHFLDELPLGTLKLKNNIKETDKFI